MANSKAKVFLSRRNLVTLLAKLDGIKQGTPSACTLIKFKAGSVEEFKQTMVEIAVTAVEDDVYYTERSPGAVREDYIDALTKKVDH